MKRRKTNWPTSKVKSIYDFGDGGTELGFTLNTWTSAPAYTEIIWRLVVKLALISLHSIA